MRHLLACALAALLPLSAAALTENRRLVIRAPAPDAPAYRDQAALLLPAWSGFQERDFVIETHFGTTAFSVVLVGKDGGEKLRRDRPVTPDELFALVDAMPMRREEVRQRAKPAGGR